MGTFLHHIEIGDPQGQRYERVEALVDTGASYTTLPASLLRSLGVQSLGQRPFELADERVVMLDIGQTWVRINGSAMIRAVVFSPGEDSILGADTLEGLGLAVDPVRKRLFPVPGLLKRVRE